MCFRIKDLEMLLRRRTVITAVTLLIVAALIYAFLPAPVPVEVAKASRGILKVTVEEEGETRVKDRFVVSAPVAGYTRRIDFKVGDSVKKGDVLAEIEPLRSSALDPRSRAEAEAAVSAAQAALDSAREDAGSQAAEADYARKELKRSKTLFDGGYISKDAFEQAETRAKQAEANRLSAESAVGTARFELEKARASLQYSAGKKGVDRAELVQVRAPVGGQVLKLHRESAGVTIPGEALIDIGDPGLLEVKVDVLSTDAVKIRPGTRVSFERWGGDTPLSGKVRTVEPAGFTKVSSLGVEEQRTLVIVDFNPEQEGLRRLGDGYSVEASFTIWEGSNVLQVPSGALFRDNGKWAAFVLENRRARLKKVVVGHSNGLATEILSGLAEGEHVIVHPAESIKDGARVRAR